MDDSPRHLSLAAHVAHNQSPSHPTRETKLADESPEYVDAALGSRGDGPLAQAHVARNPSPRLPSERTASA